MSPGRSSRTSAGSEPVPDLGLWMWRKKRKPRETKGNQGKPRETKGNQEETKGKRKTRNRKRKPREIWETWRKNQDKRLRLKLIHSMPSQLMQAAIRQLHALRGVCLLEWRLCDRMSLQDKHVSGCKLECYTSPTRHKDKNTDSSSTTS